MKAKDIYEILLRNAFEVWTNTCDGLIAGDENKDVRTIATCFKLTAELIQKAMDQNVDMIIAHEPVFSKGERREEAHGVDLKKWQLLDKSGIAVYRFHDHAHNTAPDYIHAGFIEALDLKIKHQFPRESLGVCRYELDETVTTRELGMRIKERLGVECVRIVGNDNYPLHTICLGLGSVGQAQIDILFEPGCDVFITGEVGEVCTDEYVRDACYFGENKSVLVLGHYSSEFAGMKRLAEELNRRVTHTIFLESGEVYHSI